MNISILLALGSIPFAAMFLDKSNKNEDIYVIGYITALAFTLGVILIFNGFRPISIGSVLLDLEHR